METLDTMVLNGTLPLGQIGSLESDPVLSVALESDPMGIDPVNLPATGGAANPEIENLTAEPEFETIDNILLGDPTLASATEETNTGDALTGDLSILPLPSTPIDDFQVLLPLPDDQLWSQNTPGIQFGSEAGDRFGDVVATGDFNGDGFEDLAIGVPNEDLGTTNPINNAGAVNVIYGSASGLVANGPPLNDRVFTQNSSGINAGLGAEPGDRFGASLTAGDFNGDGFEDLAVGAPDENVNNTTDAGAVNILYGSASGLTTTGSQLWTQNSAGLNSGFGAEVGDNFGESLTAGDFNGDGFVDLAIGAPGENVFDITDAGAVNVLYGGASGLTAVGDQIWHQDSGQSQASPVLNPDAEAGDNFGASLTAGDFNGDGFEDLAIGTPGESVGNIEDAGSAVVIYGSSNRLTPNGHQSWHQNRANIQGGSEPGDGFGSSLTSGDFDGDGIDDLAVGVPRESISQVNNVGAVNVIYGSTNRLNANGNQLWHQDRPGILGIAENGENNELGFLGDLFGSSLTSGDFDGDGIDDLAVGVPGEDLGSGPQSIDQGAVNILRGSSSRLTAVNDRFISQNTLTLNGESSEPLDRFGWSLAAGDFNGDGHADLAVGVPLEDIDTITNAGAVNVLYDV